MNLGSAQPTPLERLSAHLVPFVLALGSWIVCPNQVVFPEFMGGWVWPKPLALLVLTTLIALVRTVYVAVRAHQSRGRIFSRRPVAVGSYWLMPVLIMGIYLLDVGIPDETAFSLLKGLLLGVGVGSLSVGLVLPHMSYGTARILLRPRPHNNWEYTRMVRRLAVQSCVLGVICLCAVAVM